MTEEEPNSLEPERWARMGPWTVEEEEYAVVMAMYFDQGLLDIPEGTFKRAYLASALRCDPNRVTKKFTKKSFIGRRAFKRNQSSSEHLRAAQQLAFEHLERLEARYHASVKQQEAESLRCQTLTADFEARLQQQGGMATTGFKRARSSNEESLAVSRGGMATGVDLAEVPAIVTARAALASAGPPTPPLHLVASSLPNEKKHTRGDDGSSQLLTKGDACGDSQDSSRGSDPKHPSANNIGRATPNLELPPGVDLPSLKAPQRETQKRSRNDAPPLEPPHLRRYPTSSASNSSSSSSVSSSSSLPSFGCYPGLPSPSSCGPLMVYSGCAVPAATVAGCAPVVQFPHSGYGGVAFPQQSACVGSIGGGAQFIPPAPPRPAHVQRPFAPMFQTTSFPGAPATSPTMFQTAPFPVQTVLQAQGTGPTQLMYQPGAFLPQTVFQAQGSGPTPLMYQAGAFPAQTILQAQAPGTIPTMFQAGAFPTQTVLQAQAPGPIPTIFQPGAFPTQTVLQAQAPGPTPPTFQAGPFIGQRDLGTPAAATAVVQPPPPGAVALPETETRTRQGCPAKDVNPT